MLFQKIDLLYFYCRNLQKTTTVFLVTFRIKKETNVFNNLFKDYFRRSTKVLFLFFISRQTTNNIP